MNKKPVFALTQKEGSFLNTNSLTRNRYTAFDIFTKNYGMWCAIPSILLILTSVVHFAVYSLLYRDTSKLSIEEFVKYLSYLESPGDYFYYIVRFATVVALFVGAVGILSYFSYLKKDYKLSDFSSVLPVILFLAFIVLAFISDKVNCTESTSIWGYTSRGEGLFNTITYVFPIFICAAFVKIKKVKSFTAYLFTAVSVFHALLIITDKYIVHIPCFTNETFGATGVFYNCNFYGYFLSIATVLSAAMLIFKKGAANKIYFGIAFALNSFMINLCNTFGCYLACLAAFVFLAIAVAVRDKKFPLAVIICLIVFFAINQIAGIWYINYLSDIFQMNSDIGDIATGSENAVHAGTDRWSSWVLTWGYIKERPLLGWGTHGTCERLGAETVNGNELPHNEYLQYAGYYGIPAVVCYIGAIISVYIQAVRRRKYLDDITLCCLAGAFGYLGSAFFGNTMYFTAPFFFIFLGLGMVHKFDEDVPTIISHRAAKFNSELACELV